MMFTFLGGLRAPRRCSSERRATGCRRIGRRQSAGSCVGASDVGRTHLRPRTGRRRARRQPQGRERDVGVQGVDVHRAEARNVPDRPHDAVGVLPDRGPLPRRRDARGLTALVVASDPQPAAEPVVQVEAGVDDRLADQALPGQLPLDRRDPRPDPGRELGTRLVLRWSRDRASAPCRRRGCRPA